jgi:Trypsin-like peptidase domain
MKNTLLTVILIICVFLMSTCTREIHKFKYDQILDGKYDSEFPLKPAADALKQILESVRLISILTFYDSYDFDRTEQIKTDVLATKNWKTLAAVKYGYDRPSTGSSTIIYNHLDRVVLLTCAHVVNFPDTIISYYKDNVGKDTQFVQNISIKIGQNNNMVDLPELNDFKLLAIDREKDLALVGKDLADNPNFLYGRNLTSAAKKTIPVISCKLGAAGELDWGCFTYLVGYPRAKKMVSTAIVSSPNYDQHNSFLLDGSLQRGISGGLVLAVRDGVPNFELVGITNAVSSEVQYILQPDKNFNVSEWDLSRPYTGETYVRAYQSTYYGITYAIGIETVQEFIRENKAALSREGYELEYFFKE